MKYPNITLGRIEAVWNKLGGEEGVDRFLRSEVIVTEPKPADFQTWRALKLGTGLKTADDFRKALKKIGDIGDRADDILGKPAFTASDTESEVELVVRSVEELGFKDGATREQIYNRAKEIGLDLCPAEVGPQLRLQCKDQPKGEWLLIAMEPITDSDGNLRVFLVGRGDGGEQWLHGNGGGPGDFWVGSGRWVFLRRKISSQS
jgi:pterin-4a-carbinolamine dehydratase